MKLVQLVAAVGVLLLVVFVEPVAAAPHARVEHFSGQFTAERCSKNYTFEKRIKKPLLEQVDEIKVLRPEVGATIRNLAGKPVAKVTKVRVYRADFPPKIVWWTSPRSPCRPFVEFTPKTTYPPEPPPRSGSFEEIVAGFKAREEWEAGLAAYNEIVKHEKEEFEAAQKVAATEWREEWGRRPTSSPVKFTVKVTLGAYHGGTNICESLACQAEEAVEVELQRRPEVAEATVTCHELNLSLARCTFTAYNGTYTASYEGDAYVRKYPKGLDVEIRSFREL